MIAHPKPSLLFGSIELADDLTGWNADYTIEALGDDSTWGNPQPVEVTVKSLLQDGSIVATTGHDNREATFRVTVRANDGIGLALGEAALNAEVGRQNTLTWTPPDGFGPPTVFEVVTSSLEHVFDDMSELQLERTYGLRLICQPFGRSVNETTAVATGAIETFGTTRQQRRSFDVGGSARTQAAIEVVGSTGLGWTILYTGSAEGAAAIPLRPKLTASPAAAVADSGRISGAYNTQTNGTLEFTVPAADIYPGTYLMVGMLKSTATRTAMRLGVGSITVLNGAYVSQENAEAYVNLGTTYAPVALGLLNLPSIKLPENSTGQVTVYVTRTGTDIDWQADEVWLFNIDNGAVTSVNCDTAKRLWVNPPSVSEPVPSLIVGSAADRSDSHQARRDNIGAWGAHTFAAGETVLFAATAGALSPDVTLRYYKRWHTHAAE